MEKGKERMTRLCGGTFFTLLANAGRASSKSPVTFMGETRTATDAFKFLGLLRILNPKHEVYSAEYFPKSVSKYRNCIKVSYGADLPLSDSRYTCAFHDRVILEYASVLAAMKEYCQVFLDCENRERMEWLVRAIVETLVDDSEVSSKLYALPNGERISVRELSEMSEINIPALLIGCLDYIVTSVPDNTVGRDTILCWHYKKGDQRERGKLRETIGDSIRYPIAVSFDAPPQNENKPESETAQKSGEPEPVLHQRECTLETVPAQKGSKPSQELGVEAPFGASTVNNNYGTINNYNGPTMVNEGIGALELLQLDRNYYNLFIVDGELFESRSFMLPLARSLNDCIREEIRDKFRRLTEGDIAHLMHIPSVFATPNDRHKSANGEHQAILGRLTGIRVQGESARFNWKPYCLVPQQIFNENERLFNIWYADAVNELDDEHWTIKDISLLDAFNAVGFNPFRYVF
ncbi:MAG: hypothetical protein IJ719_13235 [Clostridia bacterium]|nr:hypothetical protein [Clostridia bacterium]